MNAEYLEAISNFNLRTEISSLSAKDEQKFLEMTLKSKDIHEPWVSPPTDVAEFKKLLDRNAEENFVSLVVRPIGDKNIAGVFNLSQIFRGCFQNTILGCYANIEFHRQGYMRDGLLQTIAYAFFELKLHRIEANAQPNNERSIKLFSKLGFRLEGLSKNYLMIDGAWRDHSKFALTRQDWGDVVSQHRQSI